MKKIVFLSLLALILFTGCFKKNNENDNQNNEINKSLDDLNYESDLLEISSLNDILKLDYINPGLDKYDIKVVLYSKKENKVTGEISLPTDTWNTGLLNDGFYAISLNSKDVLIYNKNCEEVKKYKIDSNEIWAFANVSPDGNTLIYADGLNTNIIAYDLETNTKKTIGSFKDYIESLGFIDNNLYLKDGNGNLFKLNKDSVEKEKVLTGLYTTYLNNYYGIGKTDNNFVLENENKKLYVGFDSIDELPIYANDFGFVTYSLYENDVIFKVYDIEKSKKTDIKIPISNEYYPVVSKYDDENIIIAIKNKDNKYEYYVKNIIDNDSVDIKINNNDVVSNDDNEEDYEVSIPDYETKTEIASKYIENVPVIKQFPNYPTGCESVSATIALQYAKEKITVDEFIDNYLDKSSNFYYANGKNYGPNPNETFVGNPRSKSSFGCMAPVIEKALKKYYGNNDYVINATGKSLEEIKKLFIDAGYPVLVWVSINMIDTYYTSSWYLENGEQYKWLANEHCMVLIGYDSDNYYFVDPYKGSEVMYKKDITEKRYKELGMQAVVIVK